jgi:hypothetical protein
MTERTLMGSAGPARLELLEPRFLLSAQVLGEPVGLAVAYEPVALVQPAVEEELNGGPANNDVANAQALTFDYLLPVQDGESPFGPQQAAVLGTADGGGGPGYYCSYNFYGFLMNPDAVPSIDLDLPDATAPGGDGVLAITALANLYGPSRYLTLEAEGIALGDVFVNDGQTGLYSETAISLTRDQLVQLAADGVITFTVTPSSAVAPGVIDVTLELSYPGGGGGTPDFYSFDLAAGESASLSLVGLGEGDLELQLCDAEGNALAAGEGAENVDLAIGNFVAEEGGTYYVRIAGEGDYELVVNRNAIGDLEDNGGIAMAQDLAGAKVDQRRWAVGSVADGAPEVLTPADVDCYAVELGSLELLTAKVFTPGQEDGLNGLRPQVCVYGADGSLLAKGLRAVRFQAPKAGGTYYVQVGATNGTEGDYVLSVKTKPSRKAPRAAGRAAKKLKKAADKAAKRAAKATVLATGTAPKVAWGLGAGPSSSPGQAAKGIENAKQPSGKPVSLVVMLEALSGLKL